MPCEKSCLLARHNVSLTRSVRSTLVADYTMSFQRHNEQPVSRRDFLRRAGAGFGGLALASMLAKADAPTPNPLAARHPHFAGKAKSVIWIFCDGGPSHIDLFDPKPALARLHGQPLPASFPRPQTSMG